MSNYDEEVYMRAMFGQHAMHVPMNFIVQAVPEDNAFVAMVKSRIAESTIRKLIFKSRMPHQLIISDVIIRPQLVVESKHLVGVGLSGIATSGDSVEDWVRHGKVLYNYKS